MADAPLDAHAERAQAVLQDTAHETIDHRRFPAGGPTINYMKEPFIETHGYH